jgi:hypothetical protein
MEKTMKTVKELDAELELLKSDIDRQHDVLDGLNKRKRDLMISISNATISERRKAERRARIELNATRKEALRLAKKYDIEWVDDSYYEDGGEYWQKIVGVPTRRLKNLVHYFPQPAWLEGDDPLKDGHYANNWDETLWLVEFYARSTIPEHPDYWNSASIWRSRHTVKPKPPSGGLRGGWLPTALTRQAKWRMIMKKFECTQRLRC